MRSDEIEARIRQLGDAVGTATVVTQRDVDVSAGVPTKEAHRRVPSGVLRVAAIAIVIVGLATALSLVRSGDGADVSTVKPSEAGDVAGTGGLPRLAPGVLPDGYVLDSVQVTQGELPPIPQMVRYRSPQGVPLDLSVVPAQAVDSYLDPGFAGGQVASDEQGNPTIVPKQSGNTVDINGRHGVAVVTKASMVTGDASQDGYLVSWHDEAGNRLALSTRGMSQDQAAAIAREASVVGPPDAPMPNIDPGALPAGFVETYAGLEFGAIGEAKPSSSPGVVVLGYRDAQPAPPADPTIRFSPKIDMREYVLPDGGDPGAWLRSFGPRSETFSAGDVDFVLVPSLGVGAPSTLYGIGDGALLVVFALGPTADELRQMMASVHELAPSDWAAYLGSAATAPFPPRTEAPDDVALCDGLRTAQVDWQNEMLQGQLTADSSLEGVPGTVAEDVLSDLEAKAPPQQADDLRAISEAHHRPGQLGHDDIVSLRKAVRDLESWTRQHCAADRNAEPVDLYPLTQGLPSLDDQDPALDDFCQGFQAMKPYETTTPDGQTDFPAKADQLELLLPRIPAAYPDVRTKATELIERWREVPVGATPSLRPNDPLGLNAPAIAQRCPDWPN